MNRMMPEGFVQSDESDRNLLIHSKELKKQGYQSAKEIFSGICYDGHQLTLFPLKNEKR